MGAQNRRPKRAGRSLSPECKGRARHMAVALNRQQMTAVGTGLVIEASCKGATKAERQLSVPRGKYCGAAESQPAFCTGR
ncbi:hypothetical protein [Croceicoccus sp. Ery15]|uniref:hypothetical protein n=1 Tax=Croceicoccus sp. Ery15 TaxID=1703338 RepID=UPI001E50F9ED|nr:hypothetical protein [Croceicoccus sp. Ery15]